MGAHNKGGLIKYLLFYDLFCFLLCTGAIVYIVSTRPEGIVDAYDDWVLKQSVFACQIIYGYLSLPFFFFALPYFQNVLLHTVPTGYDKKGRTRGFKWPESVEEQRRKEAEEDAKGKGGLLGSTEVDEMLQSLKSIFVSKPDTASEVLGSMGQATTAVAKAGTSSESAKLPGQPTSP